MHTTHFTFYMLLFLLLSGTKCNKSKLESENSKTELPRKDSTLTPPIQVSEPTPEGPTVVADVAWGIWQKAEKESLTGMKLRIEPKEFVLWKCTFDSLMMDLNGESTESAIAFGDGVLSFRLQNSSTMSPELAKKFPRIKSYKGTSKDGRINARLDVNEEGLFIEFNLAGNKSYLSPIVKDNKNYYAYYPESAIDENQRDSTFK